MSWTVDLVTGIAERLDAAGVAKWDPAGIYQAADTAIVLKVMPSAPDRVLSLTVFPVTADAGQSHVIVGVQVRARAGKDPRDVDDLTDLVYEQLHGAENVDLHGVLAAKVWLNSGGSLGQDGNGRWETSSNYYLLAARPTLALTD